MSDSDIENQDTPSPETGEQDDVDRIMSEEADATAGDQADADQVTDQTADQVTGQDDQDDGASAKASASNLDYQKLGERAPGGVGAHASAAKEDDGAETRTAGDLEQVYDIPVNVSAVLGKSHLQVSELLKLNRGAIVELDRKVGEAIDIYVNNRLVARGEVVLVEDRLGVTMTEIIKNDVI